MCECVGDDSGGAGAGAGHSGRCRGRHAVLLVELRGCLRDSCQRGLGAGQGLRGGLAGHITQRELLQHDACLLQIRGCSLQAADSGSEGALGGVHVAGLELAHAGGHVLDGAVGGGHTLPHTGTGVLGLVLDSVGSVGEGSGGISERVLCCSGGRCSRLAVRVSDGGDHVAGRAARNALDLRRDLRQRTVGSFLRGIHRSTQAGGHLVLLVVAARHFRQVVQAGAQLRHRLRGGCSGKAAHGCRVLTQSLGLLLQLHMRTRPRKVYTSAYGDTQLTSSPREARTFLAAPDTTEMAPSTHRRALPAAYFSSKSLTVVTTLSTASRAVEMVWPSSVGDSGSLTPVATATLSPAALAASFVSSTADAATSLVVSAAAATVLCLLSVSAMVAGCDEVGLRVWVRSGRWNVDTRRFLMQRKKCRKFAGVGGDSAQCSE